MIQEAIGSLLGPPLVWGMFRDPQTTLPPKGRALPPLFNFTEGERRMMAEAELDGGQLMPPHVAQKEAIDVEYQKDDLPSK